MRPHVGGQVPLPAAPRHVSSTEDGSPSRSTPSVASSSDAQAGFGEATGEDTGLGPEQ
ncbi:MAG: hypothetical protein U5R31_13420 [Acidimicrobiia bacterium]|nr:hypothetical protein [Acidimicrobiia bacterium]